MAAHVHASASIEDEPIPARPALAVLITTAPMRPRVVAVTASALTVLIVAGIPLSALLPFAGLGACLGMHLLMGHRGHSDGSGHGR